jgi:hypothetical protein
VKVGNGLTAGEPQAIKKESRGRRLERSPVSLVEEPRNVRIVDIRPRATTVLAIFPLTDLVVCSNIQSRTSVQSRMRNSFSASACYIA